MKLFGSFKLTDRIRIGASTGGRKKKSSSKGSTGCGLIILALLVICVPISLIKSCVGGDEKETTTEATTITSATGIEKLVFARDEFELDAGEDTSSWVKVSGTEDFTKDDFIFVSSDENIATFEYEKTSLDVYLYFKLTGISPGTTTIYVKTSDNAVISEEITVTVLEADTITEAETTEKGTVAPVVAKKTTEPTTKKVTTTAKQIAEKTEYVLNTNTMKIHESHCDSVKDIKPHNYDTTKDFDKAIAQGYVPCKRCNPTGN